MEAKYENSANVRLEVLNAMIAMAQSIGFNQSEMPQSITVVVERENGETVTERLPRADIEKAISAYIEKIQAA